MNTVKRERRCNICGGIVTEVFNPNTKITEHNCSKCGYHCINQEEKNEKYETINPCGAYYFELSNKDDNETCLCIIGSCGENLKEEEILQKFNPHDDNFMYKTKEYKINSKKSYITYRDSSGNIKVIWGEGNPRNF